MRTYTRTYIHCKPAKNAKHRAQGEKKSVFCIPIVFHRDPGSGSSLKSEYGAVYLSGSSFRFRLYRNPF